LRISLAKPDSDCHCAVRTKEASAAHAQQSPTPWIPDLLQVAQAFRQANFDPPSRNFDRRTNILRKRHK
jgi:hypothetical protein